MNTMNTYASVYHQAVREATRVQLQLAINRIERATHAVVHRRKRTFCYCYGSLRECEQFALGLERHCVVIPMTRAHKEREITHKVQVYRNP